MASSQLTGTNAAPPPDVHG